MGTRAVRLYPIHHPAAALYTRSLQDTLREDFARLPGLLELPEPDQPEPEPEPSPSPTSSRTQTTPETMRTPGPSSSVCSSP